MKGGNMEDEEIIKLYLNRNENAINETNKKYGKYCSTIAYNVLCNKEDTEECVNDTFLHTWNTIPPKIPNIFKAFLAKITRNLALNKYESQKAKKRNNNMDLVYEELENCIPSNSGAEVEISYSELVNEINIFLEKLPLEKRTIFLERYWYFQSIKNISIKYDQTESKTKMTLLRIRNSLKEHLEEREVL